jgi:hypothetical protein
MRKATMAHHGNVPGGGIPEGLRKALGLGATGAHPQGKISEDDEGETRIAIGTNGDGKIIIDFGNPTAWVGFDAGQALALADSLRAKAHAVIASRRESSGVRKTVCVDLDGVLAHYDGWKGVDHIGDPRPGAREFMEALGRVAKVVVFTTRAKADFEDRPEGATPEAMAAVVREWLGRHGIAHDEVYCGQGKPMAAAYLDDRAVPIPSNPGPDEFAAALDAVRVLI